tara:strand:+ start:260 stop:436 length:177 start_codon:yes stop_codon:yes gene_type:complete
MREHKNKYYKYVRRKGTNPNLLNIILSFAGVKIKRNVCGMILKYKILNQEIEYDHVIF